MGTVTSSGAISLNAIKAALGGPTSPALNNYYRGGTYTPSSRTVSALVYEPAGGGFTAVYTQTLWSFGEDYNNIYWNGVGIGSFYSNGPSLTQVTVGAYTYYRGSYGVFGSDTWSIRRTYMGTSTTQINTGVPSSGQISISQLYGATNP